MTLKNHLLWEDDEFVYIPQELFEYLPEQYRESAEALKDKGENALRIVDKDLKGLVKLLNAIPTTSSLGYINSQLRSSKFEPTANAIMQLEMLTTAFVVTYGRLFASGEGTSGVSKKSIPKHLIPIHDELIDMRNKRYAHNAVHKTVDSGISVDFTGDEFKVQPQISLGFYVGGKDEWGELVTFLDAHMHDRLSKILKRLSEKTGYEWTFPSGPQPDWLAFD